MSIVFNEIGEAISFVRLLRTSISMCQEDVMNVL